MAIQPDTTWTDDEIVMTEMTPDTDFVFERMTNETLKAVAAKPNELILDVACGRAIDALALAGTGAKLVGIEASEIMIQKAREFMGDQSHKVTLARALAENLPFPDNSFDKVVCKGAMDHFADIETSMAEMARITKPDGAVIIAIANFESATCVLGKTLYKIRRASPPEHPFWEPPDDHNFKFDLPVLKDLMAKHCQIKSIVGVSMLWGFPKWGAFLDKLPKPVSSTILLSLDNIARMVPSLSDVLIAVGRPK